MQDHKKQIKEIERLYKQYLGKRTLEEYLILTKNSKSGDEETTTDPLFRDMLQSEFLWNYSGDNVLLQQQKHKITWNGKEQKAKPDFETNNEFCKTPILFDSKSSNISYVEMTSGNDTVYETTFKRYLLAIKPEYKYIVGFNLSHIFLYEKLGSTDVEIKIVVDITKLLKDDANEVENLQILLDETGYKEISMEDKINILKNKAFEDTPFNTELFFEKYVYTRNKLQRFFKGRLEKANITENSCDDYIKADLPNSDNDDEFRDQLANRLTMIEFFKYIFIRTYEDFGLIHFSEEDKKIIPVSYGKVISNLENKTTKALFNDFETTFFEDYITKISKQGITDIGKEFFDGFSTLFKKYEGFIDDLILNNKDKYDYYTTLFDIIFFLNEFNFRELGDDIIGGLYEKTLDREDRKKFGQFYTPRYIIDFILDTLGIRPNENIKIADISCGTGGFLVKYLSRIKGDMILDENKLADVFKGTYGVDIKGFSVLLTKLNIALMFILKNKALKEYKEDAKKIRLNNIIQGDGLGIQNTLPFKDGELNFVVGNPPYVGQKGNSEIFDPIKSDSFYKEMFVKRSDLYYYFIIDGIKKLREGGKLGYIIPRERITSDSGHKLREYILNDCRILGIIDFNGISIFEDAGTSSCLLFLQKGKRTDDNVFSFIQFKDFDGKNLVKYIEANKDKLHKKTSSEHGEAKHKIDTGYEIFSTKIMRYENFKRIIESIEKNEKFDISFMGGLTSGKIFLNDFLDIKKIHQSELSLSTWLFGERIGIKENLVKLGDVLSVSVGIQTGCDNITNKHIKHGLVPKGWHRRGIFVLQENIEIRGDGLKDIVNKKNEIGKIEINFYENGGWKQLNDKEKKLIKPRYGGKDLNNWHLNRNTEWIIYYHIKSELFNDNDISTIIDFLNLYKLPLLNRSTNNGLVIDDNILNNSNNIKNLYSKAGSIQATLGKGIWNIITFPREIVPFEKEKIVILAKGKGPYPSNYNEELLYFSPGVNYVFVNEKNPYTTHIVKYSNKKDFLKYINIILNSNYIVNYMKKNGFNQLTSLKLQNEIKIPKINFEDNNDINIYNELVDIANQFISLENETKITIGLKKKGEDESIDVNGAEFKNILLKTDFKLIESPIGIELLVDGIDYMLIGIDTDSLLKKYNSGCKDVGELLGVNIIDNKQKQEKIDELNKRVDELVNYLYKSE